MALWSLDPIHSEIKFKVKHLMVAHVTGNFQTFSGTVEAEKEDFSDAKISFEANTDSVTTHNEQRDAHLKTADFFHAAEHPKMKFVSKSIEKKSDEDYTVKGDLTILGITKEVSLAVTYYGTAMGFGGVQVAGFEIHGKVNRQDFGLKFNALTETGGFVIGDEVKIDINVELHKQAAEALKQAA
jgi:polyisoprenoid-binding protein YceI